MDKKSLHLSSQWLYGTIVALAIRESLTRTIPHNIATKAHDGWTMLLEGLRLMLYLAMVIRFYFGSIHYFSSAYTETRPVEQYADRRYEVDFFVGLFHFILFFAWATTVDTHTRWWKIGISPYMAFLGGVLIYDLWWAVMTWGFTAVPKVSRWACINVLTFVGCLLVVLVGFISGADTMAVEEFCYVPVAIATVIDLRELATGKEITKGWFKKLAEEPLASEAAD